MADLEYQAKFKTSNLINDSAERIRKTLGIDYEYSQRLAKGIVNNISSQGNSAIYQGLIKEIIEQARKDYIEACNEHYG